jgi:hypothetical protein
MTRWNYDTSLERSKRRYEEVAGVEISDLCRAIDFDNISLLNPRRVHGVHLYVDIPGFAGLVGDDLDDDDARRVLRRLHLQHRELTRVCEAGFGAAKVHFQGPRLHAVVYRPIGDDDEITIAALAFAGAARGIVESCDGIFGGDEWDVAVGMDLGDAVATKNNIRGDRELLFIGTPANRAAKILDTGILATPEFVDALPDEPGITLGVDNDGVTELDLDDDALEDIVAHHGWSFDPEASEDRIRAELAKWPLARVGLSAIQGPIDKNTLGLANSKRVEGAAIFADVDGFTAYVDDLGEDDADLEEAVRAFHVLRSEMRAVVVADHDALRIQYQGDRLEALSLVPVGDADLIAEEVVDVAAGLNASVEHVLPGVIGAAALPLAIGAASGTVYVSRLGEHGGRDMLCVGIPNEAAAAIQLSLAGAEFGITGQLYDRLGADLRDQFQWSATRRCYTATGLSADVLARAVKAPAVVKATSRPYHPGDTRRWD